MKAPYLGLQHEAIEADDGADPTMGSAVSSSAVGLRKAPPRRSFVLNLRMERQRDKSNVGPSLIAPTKTPEWAAARARQRGAFKLSGWARSIPTPRPPAYSKMGFDRAL